MTEEMIREAVGVFDDYDRLQDAIAALGSANFGRHQISVLGSEEAVKDRFGQQQTPAQMLKDNPDAPRSMNIAPEELGVAQGVLMGAGIYAAVGAALLATGGMALPGAIVTTILVGAGGGAAGAVLAKMLGQKYAEFFQKQIDKGGLLLWVEVPDKEREEKALAILSEHGARDLHVHEMPLTDLESEEQKKVFHA